MRKRNTASGRNAPVNANRDNLYHEIDIAYSSGDLSAVETLLKKRTTEAERARDKIMYIMCMSELGAYYRGISNYRESINMFGMAEKTILEEYGECTLEYATNLNNTAGAYRMMGEYGAARDLFLKALDIYERIGQEKSYFYAGALNNVALLYQSTGEYGKALDYLEECIGLLKTFEGSKDELATAYTNQANCFCRENDLHEAGNAADRAIEIFEALPEKSAHFAAALNIKATLNVSAGDYAEAKENYRAALEHIINILGENADYAVICKNLAVVCEKLGEKQEAIKRMKEAYVLLKKIYSEEHMLVKDAHAELLRMEELRR